MILPYGIRQLQNQDIAISFLISLFSVIWICTLKIMYSNQYSYMRLLSKLCMFCYIVIF